MANNSRSAAVLTSVRLSLCVAVACLATSQCVQLRAEEPAAPQPARGVDAPSASVVLLTGFQPFGVERQPNSSWEGIKKLDGQMWRGFKLVCREMRVQWDAPLEELEQWIDELRPIAVFSFGQGRDDGFALESRARVARGFGVDNLGRAAPAPTIVAGGPDEYSSTAPIMHLAIALSQRGYPTCVSTDAGQYLCEEALYSLETLKARRNMPGTVLFCHVPPLGARVGDMEVTAELVEKFVGDLLDAWHASPPRGPGVDGIVTPVSLQSNADSREKEVRELIDRYFATWSARDIERYGQCFLPQAAIQLIDQQGRLATMPLGLFLESQREAHRQSGGGLKETPESVEVRFERQLARVIVYWKLVDGERTEFGYDHFTLMRAGGRWRIANLVFYSTPPQREAR